MYMCTPCKPVDEHVRVHTCIYIRARKHINCILTYVCTVCECCGYNFFWKASASSFVADHQLHKHICDDPYIRIHAYTYIYSHTHIILMHTCTFMSLLWSGKQRLKRIWKQLCKRLSNQVNALPRLASKRAAPTTALRYHITHVWCTCITNAWESYIYYEILPIYYKCMVYSYKCMLYVYVWEYHIQMHLLCMYYIIDVSV